MFSWLSRQVNNRQAEENLREEAHMHHWLLSLRFFKACPM